MDPSASVGNDAGPGGLFLSQQDAVDAMRRVLQFVIGVEAAASEGLMDTPARVVRALVEMTSGNEREIADAMRTKFIGGDGVVAVTGIRFASLCEHHLLPFVGTVGIAYLPPVTRAVLGLSKLPRIVSAFARRLQLQERMTEQIANAIAWYGVEEITHRPRGVAVVVRAHHSCMGCRGVRQADAVMTTSTLLGVFMSDPEARSEALSLLRE